MEDDRIVQMYKNKYVLFLGLSFLLLITIVIARAPYRQFGALFVSDGFGYYIYLPSVIIDKDLNLKNQIEHQPCQLKHWTFAFVPQTGRFGNIFQIGCAVLWLPFFLFAHCLVLILIKLGFSLDANGFGYFYELPVYIGSFIYGLCGIFFMWRLVREIFDDEIADNSVLYIVLASPLAAYLWFEPDMSHIISMFLISIFFYYLYKVYILVDQRLSSWALLGALFGLIVLVRVPDCLVGVLAFFVWLKIFFLDKYKHTYEYKSAFKSGAIFICLTILVFSPQLFVWKILYGSFLAMPPNPFYKNIQWLKPDLFNYMFSTRHGLFSWTPILCFASIGIIWFFFWDNYFLKVSSLIFLLAIYFNSSIYRWWAGCSFGERRMVDYSVIFALGLGLLLFKWRNFIKKNMFWVLGTLLILYNWILMVRYFTHDLPEYGQISFYDLYIKTIVFPLTFVNKFF